MGKKILIITDMEGISGLSLFEEIQPDYENYNNTRKLLMDDTNAAVEGAFLGGATEVYVTDGHGSGKNFIEGMLDKRAVQIPASELVSSAWDMYDAIISLGAHTMAGTEKGFLDHTQDSHRWFEYKVGGKAYGEIGQQAITAGVYNVPLVAVTGDLLACKEAKELVPNIATAVVKTGIKRNKADCLPQEEALELIKNAVCDGVKRCNEIKPYKIDLPTEVELTLCRSDYCDDICSNSKNITRNGRTVKTTVNEIKYYKDILFR